MSNTLPIAAVVIALLAGATVSANAAPPSKRQEAPAGAGNAAAPADAPKPAVPDNAVKAPDQAKTEPATPPASSATPPAAAGGMATAQDIKVRIAGNTILGSMNEGGAYTEYYDPDGTVVGADYTGKWTLEGDKMCFVYGSDPKSCYAVKIEGTKVTWVLYANEIGTGNIVPGNPSKLMGAAAEPEAAPPQAAAPAAKSEKIDMASMSCSELISEVSNSKSDQLGLKFIMYWMSGYLTSREVGTVFDPKAIKAETEKIKAQCRKQPKVGVLTTARSIPGMKHGRDAIDLATITCKSVGEAAGSAKESDSEELVLRLMWLAGYHRSFNEDAIMDSGWLDKNTENIIKYCAENPEMSLVTAAKKFMAVEGK